MRRFPALIALLLIPIAACGTSATTPAAQPAATATAAMSGPASMADATEMSTGTMASSASARPPVGSTGTPSPPTSADPTSPSAGSTAADSPTSEAAPGVTITTADSAYGRVLFDGSGQAIYLFDRETGSVPDCYDDCAVAWPPVVTAGTPVGTEETRTDLLGTTPRNDGSIQVTYAGHPLYYYAHEDKNEVTCHDVDEFGGLWLAVAPTGVAAA
jgi:predicted lipoprotein with Yx(FWY)xxD motif